MKRGDVMNLPVLYPDYPPQRITIVSRCRMSGDGWYRVRFQDGGCLVVHESRMEPCHV